MSVLLSRLRQLGVLLCLYLALLPAQAAVDAASLLPAEKAFVPQLTVDDQGITVRFDIADGYYLYRSRIDAATDPADLLAEAEFAPGKQKSDEFFGTQEVYYHQTQLRLPYRQAAHGQSHSLTLNYQGCAEAGVCYPPAQIRFDINGNGEYRAPAPASANPFLQSDERTPAPPAAPNDSSRFKLSWDTLNANLLAFFVAGVGLSLTACMYPLLPIVSSIVVGDRHSSPRRAFALSMVYVQGLALTYTLVGLLAGLTGALLTVWLQQAWVVLAAAAVMVALALAMFDVYTLQLPAALQGFFQSQSQRLSGGKLMSVFVMGMLSALIVGPCVAPPLAFALGYIGQTGDAWLGGLALYALALGTGVPLILVATFGSRILPRAGAWMNGVKYAFGVILLAVAVYLATPFLPYAVVIGAYTLLMVIPAGLLLVRQRRFSGSLKTVSLLLGSVLLMGGVYFAAQSTRMQRTGLHQLLTLSPPDAPHFGRSFQDPAQLKAAMAAALAAQPQQPVWLDFYADWCVSCKEMAAHTFNDPAVQAALDEARFFQIDVTANSPEHQTLLKEYGLFGPPGLFAVFADGRRSEPLLGFAPPSTFLPWLQAQQTPPATP